MSVKFFLVYSITIFVASIVPGPSMLLALTHGMKYGAKRTIASAFGNLSITLLQAAVSIAGLGAILLASKGLFNTIKWIGAAYLIYMGIAIWRSSDTKIYDRPGGDSSPKYPLSTMFLQGVVVTAGNPKAIVFFTAVFPQFIDPNRAYVPQFITLMGTGGLIAFSCFMIYAVGGQKIMFVFSKTSVRKYINRIIGSTFIGTGIGIALSNK